MRKQIVAVLTAVITVVSTSAPVLADDAKKPGRIDRFCGWCHDEATVNHPKVWWCVKTGAKGGLLVLQGMGALAQIRGKAFF